MFQNSVVFGSGWHWNVAFIAFALSFCVNEQSIDRVESLWLVVYNVIVVIFSDSAFSYI